MTPSPSNSDFVFDTEAWSSMASHVADDLSYNNMTMQCEAEVDNMAFYGEAASRPQPHWGGWNNTTPHSSLGANNASRPCVATTAAGWDCPPSPMKRTKSSPSLATMMRRSPLRSSLPRKLNGGGETSSREGTQPRRARAVSAARSRSCIAPNSNDNNDAKTTNNRNRRREILGLLHRQSSSRSILSESEIRCKLHPQVRIRSNRCPRCAAGKTQKKMRSKSFVGKKYVSPESEKESDMKQEMPEAEDTLWNTDTEEEEIEEVSLDPKWAEALRGISLRLAYEKTHPSMDTSNDDFVSEPDIKGCNSMGAPVETHKTSMSTLNELQKTIVQATKSIGRFSVDDTDDEEEEDDDISRSSLARNTPRFAKTFAESKKQSPQQCYFQAQQQCSSSRDFPLSQEELFAETKSIVGTDVLLHQDDDRASHCSNGSSGSDESSVTLSVASGYTLESYNSLAAPPPTCKTTFTSPLAPTRSSETFESPTSVMNSKDLYPDNRNDDDDSSQEEEEDQEEDQDFQNSFFIAVPKDYSEKKMTIPISTGSVVNDKYKMASKAQECGGAMHYQRLSPVDLPPPENYGHHDNTRKEDHTMSTKSMQRKSSFKKESQQPHKNVQVLVEEATDESSDDEGTMASSFPNKSVAAPKSQPSFFSALVHNSRSRSQSRSRRSHSRSKSRTRNDAGGAETARPTKPEVDKPEDHGDGKPKRPIPSPKPEAETKPKVVKLQEDTVPSTNTPVTKTKPPVTSHSCFTTAARGPITHPQYKLGETARDEDIIVFPKLKSRHGRSRRGRSKKNRSKSSQDSSCSDGDGEAEESPNKVNIHLAIGQLRHLDAAFVRRSDGSWTYALVADGDDNEIRFVVNDRGSTKSFPKSIWESSVRRVRVLTQRQGDRMVLNSKPSRKRRSIKRSRSFRGRGKGRLVSPSPTRRNSYVLNLPPTIMEDKQYNN
mmetsp:Transcript_19788/g.42960  ORF Transcript_19788/g.42960 Transcript_19788/m.42960 type:complete len:942 (+) Transcript_19788:185-3010(+)